MPKRLFTFREIDSANINNIIKFLKDNEVNVKPNRKERRYRLHALLILVEFNQLTQNSLRIVNNVNFYHMYMKQQLSAGRIVEKLKNNGSILMEPISLYFSVGLTSFSEVVRPRYRVWFNGEKAVFAPPTFQKPDDSKYPVLVTEYLGKVTMSNSDVYYVYEGEDEEDERYIYKFFYKKDEVYSFYFHVADVQERTLVKDYTDDEIVKNKRAIIRKFNKENN